MNPAITRPTMVTGAGGFIARSLIPTLLGAGYEILAVTRPGGSPLPDLSHRGAFRSVECDLGDPGAVRALVHEQRPAAVVNLAVTRTNDMGTARRVNSRAVAALVDAAGAVDSHLVHAGSSTEYGCHDVPLGPATTCRPASALGITKLEATRLISEAVRVGRVRACVLRLFHIYGEGEPSHRLVPTALRAAYSGKPLALTEPGLGHDLVAVADVNQAILLALEGGLASDTPIDVCTGRNTTNEAVVDLIEAETGRPINRQVGAFEPRDWDRPVWTGDPGGVSTLLRRPPRSLSEGLRSILRTTATRGSR